MISCVYFLKIFSANFSFSKYFQKSDDIAFLAKSLFAEQNLSNLCDTTLPLEDTWLSGNVEYLLQTASGPWKLDEGNFITFRVLNRLADILEGNEQVFHSGATDIFKENNDYNMSELKDTSAMFKRIKEHFKQVLDLKVLTERTIKHSSVKGINKKYISLHQYKMVNRKHIKLL